MKLTLMLMGGSAFLLIGILGIFYGAGGETTVSYTHLGMIQLQRKVKLEKFFGGVNRKENEPQNPEQA